MYDAILFHEAISLTHFLCLVTDCKAEFPSSNIGNLGVRMTVQRSNCTGFKTILNAHGTLTVSKNFADDSFTIRSALDIFLKIPTLIFLRCRHFL